MQFPTIKKIENYSDLMNLLSSSEKYSKRLKDLNDLQELINTQVKSYEEYQSADKYMNAAQAKIAEAEKKEHEAEEYAAKVRKEAALELDKAKQRAAEIVDKARQQLADAEGWVAKLREKETELTDREARAAGVFKHAEEVSRRAHSIMAEGTALKNQYQERLAKIKEAAA